VSHSKGITCRVCDCSVLKRMYVPEREEVTGRGGYRIMRSFMTFNAPIVTRMIGLRRMKRKRRRKIRKGEEWLWISSTNLLGRRTCSHTCKCGFKRDLNDKGWKDVDWINLAEGRDHWQAAVITAVRLQKTQVANHLHLL
jgi:hypothetical protein